MLRLALVALLFASACARAPLLTPRRPTDRPTVFSQVRVFDGKSEAASQPVDVLVRGGRIEQISMVVPTPPGAEVVDARGLTLLPGLFDAHVHLGGSEGEPPWEIGKHLPDRDAQAAAFLWCGVTTAVLAGHDTDSRELQRDVTARRIAGPRVLRATRIFTAPNGHPVYMYRSAVPSAFASFLLSTRVIEVAGDEAARAAVREELADEGVHHVKAVYHSMPSRVPKLSREELTAIIDEAKKHDRPTFVHVGTAQGAVEAAQAGARVLMHVPWEDRLTPEQVQAIAATGVAMVTTRRIYSAMANAISGAPKFSAIEKAVLAPGMEEKFRQKPEGYVVSGWEELPAQMPGWDENVGANVKALEAAGVTLIAGTDTGIPGMMPGAGLHEELKALVALGLTPARVLRMATSDAAKAVDPSGKRGVIEAGAVADLLLVRGDPLANIEDVDQIVGVWLKGERAR